MGLQGKCGGWAWERCIFGDLVQTRWAEWSSSALSGFYDHFDLLLSHVLAYSEKYYFLRTIQSIPFIEKEMRECIM